MPPIFLASRMYILGISSVIKILIICINGFRYEFPAWVNTHCNAMFLYSF